MLFGPTQFTLPHLVEAPETLYLLQYSTWGHHSLAFYRDKRLVEFTYGDWALFALNKRDTWTAVSHMLFPTLGALGRKVVEWQPHDPIPPLFVDCIQAQPFQADGSQVTFLFDELTQAFESQMEHQVFHEEDGVWFVPYSVPYGFWNNCNHELAKWLVKLGGKVSGRVFWNPDFIAGIQPYRSNHR